jgi:hypothetical protein
MTDNELSAMRHGDKAISTAGKEATLIAQSNTSVLVSISGREKPVGYFRKDFIFLFNIPKSPA